MAIHWASEACDLKPDPVSGAAITRLTLGSRHSTNFYYEQPYGTPDGRRVARDAEPPAREEVDLWIDAAKSVAAKRAA